MIALILIAIMTAALAAFLILEFYFLFVQEVTKWKEKW
tara:strand:+ start:2261 stop:2374 length:114 start_codon:yes stop_codon:yes gene_type:complete